MAVTGKWFGQAGVGQWSATAARRVDWVTDTIKLTLHSSLYTPNQDTHVFASDLTNELATAGGYTAGGVTLASKTDTYDSASNESRLDAADVSWPAATFTARYAAIWKDTGTAATSPLLGWIDFGADQSPAGVTFSIVFDATGALKAVAA